MTCFRMDYIEMNCRLDPIDPWRDILIAQLADAGFESFEETDEGFKAYIPAKDYTQEQLAEAMVLEGEGQEPRVSFEVVRIEGQNWNLLWESNFEPVKIDNLCYIRAPFHAPDPTVEMEIVIEPKMSFGTGHHETTHLMSQWLLETDLRNKSLLDMGCGTGILAILAAKKGAMPVTAIDNHPFAYENTLENIVRNDVPDIKVMHGDAGLLGEDTFDVILANITKNILMADMQKYVSVLHHEGLLFLSGFLEKDLQDLVGHASKFGMEYQGQKKQKDWMAILLKKKM